MPIAFEEAVMFDTDIQPQGRPCFNIYCLGSALEPNQFFWSFFFPLSEWQKAQKYKFACQEMALNIVLGGQEDGFLTNATGVCCILPTALQGDGGSFG